MGACRTRRGCALRPELSQALFEEGVSQLLNNPVFLVDRGWLLLSTAYPLLIITIHHRTTGKLRTFRFSFDDWNDEPPELDIIDPETKQPVSGDLWPQYQSYWHKTAWASSPLITTSKAFMCLPGIREYHTHFSHKNDLWEKYKSNPDYNIFGIVSQVAQVFQKSNV